MDLGIILQVSFKNYILKIDLFQMHSILKVSTTTLLVPTVFLVIIFILFMIKIAKDENKTLTIVRYIAIVAIGLAIILFLFWVAGIREKYGN